MLGKSFQTVAKVGAMVLPVGIGFASTTYGGAILPASWKKADDFAKKGKVESALVDSAGGVLVAVILGWLASKIISKKVGRAMFLLIMLGVGLTAWGPVLVPMLQKHVDKAINKSTFVSNLPAAQGRAAQRLTYALETDDTTPGGGPSLRSHRGGAMTPRVVSAQSASFG